MNRLVFASAMVLALATGSQAAAQQTGTSIIQTQPGQSTTVVTASPGQATGNQGYVQKSELDYLNDEIRAARIALITTGAIGAVGLIVAATAASQCELYERLNYESELVCTNRGNALLAAGGTIFGLAAIGMITSGIILGVRKGQRRRLRRETQSPSYSRRLQWDLESARLEF